MAHRARKRFGQNFLIDQQVISGIIDTIHPQPEDRMVEIGPGLGALTKSLLRTLNHLIAVELDRDIVEKLRKDFSPDKLTVYSIDALKFDFATLGGDLRIIGNLPYNISTPLLFYLGQFSESIVDMHFMLQKEVVERMVAKPSTSDYGRLSVMLQYRFEMEQVFTVSAESFHPAPKVESAIVHMQPINNKSLIATDETLFSKLVATAFSQRRKTLRNTLSTFLTTADFTYLEINPGLRAENITVEQYIIISNYLAERA
ncbi:16S rRNA (adenine(1518)-N(6)/adenine(1519)-N(6))-dimethyltransferase RsmA [Nitrosomonas sp.]|uniref:16S rRNA (adenine(1518)-N(6)/adenine(1519)-N(6))- dimethyltransferase RsmA n=1 Tax=Nitrosomonas sp. TaxID=42353 RepID=UPI002080AFB0|nr:16S rRNA (adenine(1518)-N(6)/adenine(1519)-N(6))-dimethyltransferase RsmA [Nitrosomonas sp.]GJL76817.1 MAG: ribosomal RNA small subunit methyltransferase A [Nitrosomonas sp.]